MSSCCPMDGWGSVIIRTRSKSLEEAVVMGVATTMIQVWQRKSGEEEAGFQGFSTLEGFMETDGVLT